MALGASEPRSQTQQEQLIYLYMRVRVCGGKKLIRRKRLKDRTQRGYGTKLPFSGRTEKVTAIMGRGGIYFHYTSLSCHDMDYHHLTNAKVHIHALTLNKVLVSS